MVPLSHFIALGKVDFISGRGISPEMDSQFLQCLKNEDYLKEIIPYIEQQCHLWDWKEFRFGFLEKTLDTLLQLIPIDHHPQLYLCCAIWYVTHLDEENSLASSNVLFYSLEAMKFIAKALESHVLSDLTIKSIHRWATQVSLHIINRNFCCNNAFQKTLIRLTTYDDEAAFVQFKKHIDQLCLLKIFCCEEEDYELVSGLYQQVLDLIRNLPIEMQHKYASCAQEASLQLAKGYYVPDQFVTERYRETISIFRKSFGVEEDDNVRRNQEGAAEAFIKIANLFIEYTFLILGPSPCYPPHAFDIRITGSGATEEVCPYSDLDLLILVKRNEAESYMKTFIQILEIQIAALGASTLGFKVKLIQVEKLQQIESLIFKSKSLYATDSTLIENYLSAIQLPRVRKERAYHFFALRFEEFKKPWAKPFNSKAPHLNLKNQYVQLLNFLLCDIGLYFGISEDNPTDIVNALVKRGIFIEESGELIKESLAMIYLFRITAQLRSKGPNEDISCVLSQHFPALKSDEVGYLEKCYWLVLCPLYRSIEKVLQHSISDFEAYFQKDLMKNVIGKEINHSLINCLTAHLKKVEVSKKRVLDVYKELSKVADEQTRQRFIEGIIYLNEEAEDEELLIPFYEYPTPSGMRITSSRILEYLRNKILSFTDQLIMSEEIITIPEINFPRYLFRIRSLRSSQELEINEKPRQPLMEYAVSNLISRVAGSFFSLLTLLVRITRSGKNSPWLISMNAQRRSLREAMLLSKNETWFLLCALLTRTNVEKTFYDGRDNSFSFVEPIINTFFSSKVQFCSRPFLTTRLNHSLERKILEEFAALNVEAILTDWIDDVIKKENEWMILFSDRKERKQLYRESAFSPMIQFPEGTLATLYIQFLSLQHWIRNSKENLTAGDLLKQIISLKDKDAGTKIYSAYEKGISLPSLHYQEAVFGKTLTFDEIESGIYSAAKAKNELLAIYVKGNSNQIIEGEFKYFKKDPTREKSVLAALLEKVRRMPNLHHSLIFKNCSVLSWDLLEPFLHQDLQTLHLEDCHGIDNTILKLIAYKCPQLKNLLLAGNVLMTEIEGEFPHLCQLNISRCIHLRCINLKAIFLDTLIADDNPQLKLIDLTTFSCSTSLINSPLAILKHQQSVIGKSVWEKHFGKIGAEPTFPEKLKQRLKERKVRESHFLFLNPATVDGKPLTMKRKGELVKNPLCGNVPQFQQFELGNYQDVSINPSYWTLIPKDFGLYQPLIENDPSYEVAYPREAVLFLLMMHVTGIRKFKAAHKMSITCQKQRITDSVLEINCVENGLSIHVSKSKSNHPHYLKRFIPEGIVFPGSLDENLHLEILQNLSSDLFATACVSKKWNELSQQSIVKQLNESDLRKSPFTSRLNYKRLSNLIESHGAKLQNLDLLDYSDIEEAKVIKLIKKCPGLKKLAVSSPKITDDLFFIFKDHCPELECLFLQSCEITDLGLAYLSIAKVKNLQTLILYECKEITNDGLEFISKISTLKHLLFDECEITDAGIVYLLALKNLKQLQVRNCLITDAALELFGQISSLRWLDLKKCQLITDNGVAALAQQVPSLKIER